MQWIYIHIYIYIYGDTYIYIHTHKTFRITGFHAYTELIIRQKPLIVLILSVIKKQSIMVSLMKTILCVCQLQIANTVAIKFNHPPG